MGHVQRLYEPVTEWQMQRLPPTRVLANHLHNESFDGKDRGGADRDNVGQSDLLPLWERC